MLRSAETRSDNVGGVVVAAGSSRRMLGVDKTLTMLGPMPLIAWSVSALERCTAIGHIVLVVRSDQIDEVQRLRTHNCWNKVRAVVPGGSRRQDSVQAGLAALPAAEWVIIHDGARPFAPCSLFQQCLDAARDFGVAIAATPVTDTVKLVRDGVVIQTVDRSNMWAIQTPQVFRRDLLIEALSHARREGLSVTDESTLVEKLGLRVQVVLSTRDNIKVTTPEDLAFAAWLAARLDDQ